MIKNSLYMRAKTLTCRIRYFGREGIFLSRLLDKAKRFQQVGDSQSMLLTLATAAAEAKNICRRRSAFANGWKAVIDYYLAIFNIPEAERTAVEALRLGLPDSEAANANLVSIANEISSWRDCVVEANRSFISPVEAEGESRNLVIFLPSTAFGLDLPTEPHLRAGLRFVFGEVISTCRENRILFVVRGRLANHGIPTVEPARHYISHHSLDPSGYGMHIKATDRPSCFSFDSCGYSGWSKFAATSLEELGLSRLDSNEVARFFESEKRIISRNISKYGQPALTKNATSLPREFVFVGLQKPGDAVQQLAKISMLDMLDEVAMTCQARGMAVVVKRHPKCTSGEVAHALRLGQAAGLYQVSDASIHELIAGACAVCVVNSSVGAEALLHGKPVYVFGAAEYHHVCFQINKLGNFREIFIPYKMPVQLDVIKRFLYLLRHEYAVDVTNTVAASAYIKRRILDMLTRQSVPVDERLERQKISGGSGQIGE